jgi:hypothetical protein
MLDIRLNIRTTAEAEDCLPDLRAKIMSSGISDQEQTFLLDAVTSTVETWRRQMSMPHTMTLKADKKFEGHGYKVALSVRPPTAGLMTVIKRMLGRA